MEVMTTTSPARSRRPYRLGIDAHTEFVAVLVSELDAAVGSLQAAASTARGSIADTGGPIDDSALDRSVADVRRLVQLLDIIDGPGEERHLEPLSLGDALLQAAKTLGLDVALRGVPGPERFLADPAAVELGAELVLAAFAGETGMVKLGMPNGGVVQVEGVVDFTDERRVWQLRCGRRVLEGENCRVRLVRSSGSYRLEIRALEP